MAARTVLAMLRLALLWLVAFVVIELNVFGVRDAGRAVHRTRRAAPAQ